MPDRGLMHGFILDGRGGGHPVDWKSIGTWKPSDGPLWLYLDYAAPDAARWLATEAGLSPIVAEALTSDDPRPRAAPFGDDILLVIRGINRNAGAEPEDMVSVRCWLEAHRAITLRHRSPKAITAIAAALEAGRGPKNIGELTTAVVEAVLDPVVTRVDELDDQVADLEGRSIGNSDASLRGQLADLRRRAIALRRFIGPQREALTRLAGLTPSWLDAHVKARLHESADRQTRTVEELEAARERAAVTHEELTGKLSETANRRLYTLSIIAAMFLPLSFICELLGVQIGGLPGTGVSWAFGALCAFLIAVVSVQWVVFRKNRWL